MCKVEDKFLVQIQEVRGMQAVRKMYDWASQKALSPRAPLWLGLIFVLEMVLLVPMDALLILFCMHNPQRRYIYAAVATLSSFCIGIIGYAMGYLLWDSVGTFVTTHLISPAFFASLVHHYHEYESVAVFLGSLLPIPFKAVTISAGFCQVPFASYVSALLLGRALRFFFLAELMQRYGEQVRAFIDRYFGRLLVAVGAKIALTFGFFWFLGA